MAHDFITDIRDGNDITAIASLLSAKDAAESWVIFRETLLQSLLDAARRGARRHDLEGPLAGVPTQHLLTAWEASSALCARGEALNVDRAQLISALGHDLRHALSTSA